MIKNNLLKICAHNVNDHSSKTYEKNFYLWNRDGMSFLLDYKDIKLLNEAISEIRNDNQIKSNFPIKFIEDKLKFIILESLKLDSDKRSDSITSNLEKLKDELKNDIKKWTIFVPIINLKIEETISIGEIELINFEEISDMLLKSYTIWGSDSQNMLNESYFPHGEGKVFAKVSVKGVKNYVKILALYKIRLSLSILLLYKSDREFPFGIDGEVRIPSKRIVYLISNDDNERSIHGEWVGLPYFMEIGDKRKQELYEYNFDKFDQLLKNDSPDEVERRLLTSIYWYGEALSVEVQEEKYQIVEKKVKKKKHHNLEYFKLGERFIKLFTALESILIFSENEPITENIAERTANLLGTDYEKKLILKRELKRLYSLRSDIIHQGNTFVSHYDLNDLTYIVRSLIFALIEMKDEYGLKTANNLRLFIETKKFVGFY